MKLVILFGQPSDKLLAPVPLVTWSEFEVEENPDGFGAECESIKHNDLDPNAYSAYRVIEVKVDEGKISTLLVEQPSIEGTVTDA
jgi:hypothetical protein